MDETSPLDHRLLRLLARRPSHAYALVAESGAERATVYRRLKAMERAGLVAARKAQGQGPARRVLRVTPAGEAALREELRGAMRLILEARAADAPRGGRGRSPRPPIVFASGSRLSPIELRIVRHLGLAHPRQVHLVVPPGCALPPGVPALEAPWSALPFRDGFARTMLVNELPPERGLARACAEWARVLAPGGSLHVVAPAPIPRGVDPFVDFFARLQDDLFPDLAGGPAPERVTAALRRRFGRVERSREADQLVWSARR